MPEILAEVLRNNRIESRHRAIVVVTDPDGEKTFSAGEISSPTYIRSAAKPLQIMPLLESGADKEYRFSNAELAVIMASHNGEDFHLSAVESILNKADLAVDDLQCGFHRPLHAASAARFLKSGKMKSPLYNNCSGKHAGMLATCKYRGWPLDSYLEPQHLLQLEILNKVAIFAGLEADKIERGTDGCNAPVFYLPIDKIALIFARLAQGEIGESKRVFDLMSGNPEMIGGEGRFDTDFTRAMHGRAISKVGAEGLRCIGLRKGSGLGLTVKIEDGNIRAASVVALTVMQHLGLIDNAGLKRLKEYHKPVIRNCIGREVGKIVCDLQQSAL